MPELETTISKIRLPDGTVVNLSNNQKLVIPQLAVCNVTWGVSNFTGKTSLISGEDYLLELPDNFYDVSGELSRTSQTKNGATLSWDSTLSAYKVNNNPTANTHFYVYTNTSGFPGGLAPGDDIIFGSGSGNSNVILYIYYTTDGSTWTSLGNSYSATSRAKYTLPSTAVGLRVSIYVKTGTTFSNVYAYPLILVPN